VFDDIVKEKLKKFKKNLVGFVIDEAYCIKQ